MFRAYLWATCIAVLAVGLAGCASVAGSGAVTIMSGERGFDSSDLSTGLEGYIYVPVTDPSRSMTIGDVLFSDPSDAPAGTVPAVGVRVSTTPPDGPAVDGASDAQGRFERDIPDGGDAQALTLDFSQAQPVWTRIGLGTISGGIPSSVVLTAGLLSATRDMSTISHADAVQTVGSFSASMVASNSSDEAVTIDVWLSATSGLQASDLCSSEGAPISVDGTTRTYHVWQSAVPAGASDLSIETPWAEVNNGAAACVLLNPNLDQDDQGGKRVTMYCLSRPTGVGVTVSKVSVELSVVLDPSAASAASASGVHRLGVDMLE